MSYLQADRSHLVDLDTFEFVQLELRKAPAEIFVPEHFWRFNAAAMHFEHDIRGGRALIEPTTYKKVVVFPLNNLQIEIFGMSNTRFVLSYQDKDVENSIEVSYTAHSMCVYGDINNQATLKGVSFYAVLYDKFDQFNVVFDSDKVTTHYHRLENLALIPTTGNYPDKMCIGLSHNKYRVLYRGRDLYSCYAFVIGPCAILLKDNLEYDSVVLLNGAKQGVLYADAIVHSVNPRAVKMKILQK